jgi:hypothetical protein
MRRHEYYTSFVMYLRWRQHVNEVTLLEYEANLQLRKVPRMVSTVPAQIQWIQRLDTVQCTEIMYVVHQVRTIGKLGLFAVGVRFCAPLVLVYYSTTLIIILYNIHTFTVNIIYIYISSVCICTHIL